MRSGPTPIAGCRWCRFTELLIDYFDVSVPDRAKRALPIPSNMNIPTPIGGVVRYGNIRRGSVNPLERNVLRGHNDFKSSPLAANRSSIVNRRQIDTGRNAWVVAIYLKSPVGSQYQIVPNNDIDRGVPKLVRRVIFATEHQYRMPGTVGRNRIVSQIKPDLVFVSHKESQRA